VGSFFRAGERGLGLFCNRTDRVGFFRKYFGGDGLSTI
jgi:hypothetical protein